MILTADLPDPTARMGTLTTDLHRCVDWLQVESQDEMQVACRNAALGS
jgi:hypothetical protein